MLETGNQYVSQKSKSRSLFSFENNSFKPQGKYPVGQVAAPSKFLETEDPGPIDDPGNNLSITMFYKKKGSLRSDQGVTGNAVQSNHRQDEKQCSSLKNKSTVLKKAKGGSFSHKYANSDQHSGFDLINKDSFELGKATPAFNPYSNSQHRIETELADATEVSVYT